MKKQTYIVIAATFTIVAFVVIHLWHSKPATDIASLTKVLKPTTSEPIVRVEKLDDASTRLMVITGSASAQHRYVLAWSGSRWQTSEAFVKP